MHFFVINVWSIRIFFRTKVPYLKGTKKICGIPKTMSSLRITGTDPLIDKKYTKGTVPFVYTGR
jgi:hypothetical protein